MLNLNMSEQSRAFLNKHFPEFFDCADLRDALLALDNYITLNGLDANDDMTAFGHEAQAVYDEVYCCNE